ncbi:MAG: tetratricopeptide repeat protein [Kiritimatiellaeota bacterium]|nr:tetratricopeptide repeat protein [Kiritimatiellota bacterium]
MKAIRLASALLAASLLQGCGKQEALSPEQEQFKDAMRTFSERRYALAQKISKELDLPIPPQVHRFFQAAIAGDERGVIKQRKWFWNGTADPQKEALQTIAWSATHETCGVYDCVWEEWRKDAGLLKLFYEPILSVMPPGSIYFGGTDAGRFLITMMNEEQGSNVVCLTQNALCNAHYMDYLRLVYGERVWLPSEEEASQAFSQFFGEVQAGCHPRDDVDFSDGRVSVTGAPAVMVINAIIAQRIFDNNKDTHEFYIEESYVLKRMYPFLEPCGLIMRLTPDAKITGEVIAKDMAFWAKHIDLLEAQPGFASNPVARKSFAKLRCGIAGIYEYHKMYEQADTAYRQALRIDPTSAEATTRYSGMLKKQGKGKEGG